MTARRDGRDKSQLCSWIEVLISQEKEGSEVVFTITINGEEKFRRVNPNLQTWMCMRGTASMPT